MVVDLSERFQDIQALIRKVIGNVDKISPSMDEAISQYGLELFGEISSKCDAHLDWWIESVLPFGKDLCLQWCRAFDPNDHPRNGLPILLVFSVLSPKSIFSKRLIEVFFSLTSAPEANGYQAGLL